MLGIGVWTSVSLLACVLAITLLADWLVARRHGERLWPRKRLVPLADEWLGRLLWVALLLTGGAIGIRYLERVGNALPGYALLIVVALLLSLARAALYRQAALQGKPAQRAGSRRFPSWPDLLHNTVCFLVALTLLLLLVWFAGQRLHWPALLALVFGALLPNLDDPDSLLGRAIPFISRRLQADSSHREAWRTPLVAAGLALVALPLLFIGGWQVWIAIPLGFVGHLLVDLLRPQGVMLLWPLSQTKHRVPFLATTEAGGRAERWLAALLGLAAMLLILVVGVGQEPPPPVVVPTYEQTLDRYYGLRGRTLVYASVQGTWQASSQRIVGTFEVLNAAGSSYVLLDRYTGRVFSAGRAADDNLYLNSISLQTGETISVRPAEVRLDGERLESMFPLLLQMQAEPGLQHIYVSGDLIVRPGSSSGLHPDLGQASLRRIQELEDGHYSLRYLTAAELIALGDLEVETGELLVAATYAVPGSGPTVTPLPFPTAGGGGGS